MSSRVSRNTFEDREYLAPGARPRPRSEAGYYDRREERQPEFRSPSRGGRMREVDQVDVRVRERSRERERDRDPFARYHEDRRAENGAMVLRQREIETVERERPRARAASPASVRIIRRRSMSRSPSPPEREMNRVEIRDRVNDRERDRYRAPEEERVVTRIVQRERERTPSSSPEPRERIRIFEQTRSRAPSPSPSPPPAPVAAPPVIRGPVVEREVITHYTDVDHGVVYAPLVPPPPAAEPARRRDVDIDVFTSHNETRVDISEKKPRERRSSRPPPPSSQRGSRGELVVQSERNRLEIDYDDRRPNRSHSAAPPRPSRYSDEVDDEADYVESRIDERGRMGEARNGATQEWSIIDVPPGTERVRLDGAGGGAAEVTWQRYNGVRRTRFIPDRQDDATPGRRDRDRDRDRERDRSNINVQILDNGRHRDREIDIQQVNDDRVMVRAPQRDDMWTEITKDLVNREAIERLNYKYTETDYFFYILEYLHHDDVQKLVKLTERIRRNRRHTRPYSRDEIDIDVRQRKRSRSRPRRRHDDVREQEIIVDHQPARTYYR
ncbi:hypothetical protein CMQ_5682 [Grosmannia clavigera kw1407]|uniref:DUF8035 domain-containing protein n=1 Tax=Grosmannia clavigera (strain kw1407 / UAMH 11150) TaxID=655863 RepID=F0XTA3_GROCL|nr:uncharacterized protein CMQ_5682 [Grosmannia clavigera kw1407]EFW99261.1 hypothetical protein CMQ_5682 [Grosmannia clavigera kw1407]